MTTVEEKKAMKILNYYNEMSSHNKKVQYSNVLFLGIEYINNNPLLRFRLENGKQMRRQLNDVGTYYEYIPSKNTHSKCDKEVSNIKFNEIDDSREKLI